MEQRRWIRSGIIEPIDAKQARLMKLVYDKIVFYYRELHQTRPCYQYPLSLSRLMKLCKRSGSTIVRALHFLAHTVSADCKDAEPLITYDRVSSERNASHRPYRIFLRHRLAD